jgi:hypothetical protein
MPINNHGFRTRLETWQNRMAILPPALQAIFGNEEELTLTRQDCFLAGQENDIPGFIFKVILWGYPNGMQGNNFPAICSQIDELTNIIEILNQADRTIENWKIFWNGFDIFGMALSTFSKLAYFDYLTINGNRCLILDRKLVDIFRTNIFLEFNALHGITYANAANFYQEYISIVNQNALDLEVSVDQIEMFLFTFGKIIQE